MPGKGEGLCFLKSAPLMLPDIRNARCIRNIFVFLACPVRILLFYFDSTEL